tara:strand:+ start:172 stop:810 length:639 start_codon:yes stop_codon:yes gene_type:complete
MKLILENWRHYLKEFVEAHTAVKKAFEDTDPDYLEKSIEQRNPGPEAAGSVFAEPQAVQSLIDAEWTPYPHENIKPPATGFKADIPGTLGIVPIDVLPEEQEIRFQPAHGGAVKNEEGQHLAEVVAQIPEGDREVEHTTLIIGPSKEDPEKFQVWTFFPGDATPKFPDITMDSIRAKMNSEEEKVMATVADAKDAGFNFVKHVGEFVNETPA